MEQDPAEAPADLAAEVRAIVRLALPAIAHSLLQTFVFVVDRHVLGHYSEAALASMQAGGPLLWSAYATLGGFGAATVALVGRAVGAGDPARAAQATRVALLWGVLLGALAGALGSLFAPWLAGRFLGQSSPEVLANAAVYLRWTLGAMPLFMVGVAGLSALQAAGDTRTPLLLGLATNAVNLAGNLVLVRGAWGFPALGAWGSALATDASVGLEALGVLWFLSRPGSAVSLRGS